MLTQFGGKLRVFGGGSTLSYWDFGWVPFERRTPDQNTASAYAIAAMPKFEIIGKTYYGEEKKVNLAALWSHPRVVASLGRPFEGIRQVTGSCVGAGGGNACTSLAFADALIRNEPEKIVLPFWLLPYGRSRYYLGDRGPGEGSTGSTFAQAVREDGLPDSAASTLPQPEFSDMACWGNKVEMQWSDGSRVPAEHASVARQHLIQTTAVCKNADAVREAICNYYPVTIASMYAFEASVKDGVLFGVHRGSWSHQMSIQAWWDHPSLGEIYWIQNQWGKAYHGKCPSGQVMGGAWVSKADIEWICRGGEVFAFSGFQGFPARTFNWEA